MPNTVSIVGNLSSLEQISEIQTKPFDLSQIKESGSFSVGLELPTDIALVNNDLKIVVNIDVDKKIEKVLEVDTSKLAIENESGRDVILRGLVGKVKVTVKGYESDLANFGSDNLELYVSVKKEDINFIAFL